MKEKHSFHLILTVFMVATGLLQMRPLLAQGVAPKPAILVAQAQDNLISKEAMASNAAAATKGLSLSQVLDAVAATYPILVAARTEAKAAGQDLQATERLRWPTVSAVVESDTGNLRSSPNRAVQVEQTVWDAGRNSSRISESKVLADISLIKVQLQQQDVFLQVASAWQSLVSAKERWAVAQSTLDRLRKFQAQMLRRVQAEASPVIDLELVDSRILQTEVEATAAKTSLHQAVVRLQQLSGMDNLLSSSANAVYPTGLSDTEVFHRQLSQTDWVSVVSAHPLVGKAMHEVDQVKHRLNTKQAEAYPQVFVRVYKPFQRLPNNPDISTTAFVGLRYTPAAGFANLVEAQAISTRILSSEQSVEAAFRETLQILQIEQEEFINARSRLISLEKSVAGSEKVLDSYQRQFQAGRKSWLDLLNAVRELAQNEYALADSRAAMAAAMYRLQIRSGQDVQ